ncbi:MULTISPECIES: Asp23/Gls24 family envelope stress response protein [Collinsella]|uniref:Asp23/Gls24 family envelope stress response protein n=1 Tax=Collinsella sp. An268 TaxID=1965612 RepID=UPI001F12EDC8|nr:MULTISPECIES: Asp23/Gls24 family envelope stress response protein [Collinsella]MDM8162485.1 Asp23/Gls24 family envelope stress response protein [Collinsella intestinalis]
MSDIITGTLSVSNDVIADIAGYAALSCYGVVGMDEQLQGADAVRLSANERMRKGVLVKSDEQGLRVDLHVVLENGVNMKSVCENLTSAVAFTLQEIAQIDPAQLTVGIHIEALKNRLS